VGINVIEIKTETLGEHLKNLREERDISQRTMMIRTGIAQKTISRIENGMDNPRIDTIIKMTEAMGAKLVLVENHEIEELSKETV